MPTFTVEAVDPKGKRIRADIEASSANDAITKLKSRGYRPMKVNQKEEAAPPPAAEPEAPAKGPAEPRVPQRVKELVMEETSTEAIRHAAREAGMRTLRESGLLAIFDGHTTIEEVVRETMFSEG